MFFRCSAFCKIALRFLVAKADTSSYGAHASDRTFSRPRSALEAASFCFMHTISSMPKRYLPANLVPGLVRQVVVARRACGVARLFSVTERETINRVLPRPVFVF